MKAGIKILADIHVRSAGVWRAVIEAAADEEVARWRTALEGNRKLDVRRTVEMVLDRTINDVMLDLIWVLNGPEVYLKLTLEAGWTRDEYERHILDASKRLLGLR